MGPGEGTEEVVFEREARGEGGVGEGREEDGRGEGWEVGRGGGGGMMSDIQGDMSSNCPPI